MYTVIPAGYRLTVRSWENDADHESTQVIDGLSKDTVKFLLAVGELFKIGAEFSNMYDPDHSDIVELSEELKKIKNKFPNEFRYYCKDKGLDYIEDSLVDVVGHLIGFSTEYYTRVLDNYFVEFIPEDIKINIVTKEFKNKD